MAAPGPLWGRMNARPRFRPEAVTRSAIPDKPGAYAWYRDGEAIYVGKADNLRNRLGRHLGRGRVMTGSAFRRNVAESLGIATANAIYTRAYQPTAAEVAEIRAFIEGCEVTWIAVEAKADALALETALKREWLPPLTKR